MSETAKKRFKIVVLEKTVIRYEVEAETKEQAIDLYLEDNSEPPVYEMDEECLGTEITFIEEIT